MIGKLGIAATNVFAIRCYMSAVASKRVGKNHVPPFIKASISMDD